MTTSALLMIRPAAFAFNPQTAVNNSFQKINEQLHVHEKALLEFDNFVNILNVYGIKVTVIQDTLEPHTPDSVFPNNWISFHEDGTVVLYPMFADNRKLERNKNVIDKLSENFFIRSTIDLTGYEQKNAYLEGTGSMVLDRDHEIAYACLSPRTNASVLYDFCDSIGYSPVLFNAVDENEKEIYHTNVMMCMADTYVVVCFESIKDQLQRQMLTDKFKETGKEIIEITLQQMNHFAGNMLQVENIAGNQFLIMSTQAYNSLTEEQVHLLASFNPVIHSSLNTIEQNGGGSARCMMAEIFLPLKSENS
ncbi:citrulline utilization hydrolase CtlX [Niabella sp. 22666]|uniref:citrulline utilization hydrolase CtlX n=1 Tax=Niabella sp. 22666 TaxID=3453954 RepID=UPI003F84384A